MYLCASVPTCVGVGVKRTDMRYYLIITEHADIVACLILTHTDTLKVATEAYLSGLLKDAIAVARHSRKNTVRPSDVQLVRCDVVWWGWG